MNGLLFNYESKNNHICFDQLVYQIGSYHYNWHNETEIIWLLKGSIEVLVDSQVCSLAEDDILIINPNSGHATFAQENNSIAMRMHINSAFFTDYGFDFRNGRFHLNTALNKIHPSYEDMRQTLARLYLQGAKDPSNRLVIESQFMNLMNEITQFFIEEPGIAKSVTVGKNKKIIEEIGIYIEKNFHLDLNLDTLAKKYNYSSSYLSRLFKEEIGINFYEYLMRCRLQDAIRHLTDTDEKVSQIAFQTGFSDIKSFNLMFKKHFGKTPSEYRNGLTDDLTHVDKYFKENVTGETQAKLFYNLNSRANHRDDFRSPCEVCEYKTYKNKYNRLLNNISSILEKTKND